jgi:polysaccharide biosynthesis/export protein
MKKLFVCCVLLILFNACKVFVPHRMLRTGAGYEYAELKEAATQVYKIAPDDEISLLIKTNKGEKLIQATDEDGSQQQQQNQGVNFRVEYDGTINLPIVGRKQVVGMTVRELEQLLIDEYATMYKDPFVKIEVSNRKVFIFKGGNNSSVIPLTRHNTTLYEALALSGGIGDSKAHRIKIIRMVKDSAKVFQVDLSKIENVLDGNMVLQANDIIYVTPRDRVSEEAIKVLSPYLTILTTALAIYGIFIK